MSIVWMCKKEWDFNQAWLKHKEAQLLKYGHIYLYYESEQKRILAAIEREDKEFGEKYKAEQDGRAIES